MSYRGYTFHRLCGGEPGLAPETGVSLPATGLDGGRKWVMKVVLCMRGDLWRRPATARLGV